MIPVGVAGILVNQHVVDEGLLVEQGVEPGVVFWKVSLYGGHHHLVPGYQVAFSRLVMIAAFLFYLHDIHITFLAAQVILAKLGVDTLSDVVHSPVHAVQEQVDVKGIDTGVPHATLHAACPHVASVLCLLPVVLAPVLPGVAKVAAQHQLVERVRLVLAEERIVERARPLILRLEDQPEGVLRILLGQSSVSAMQAHATVDRQVVSLRTTHQLDAGRACPSMPRVVAYGRTCEDIDTAMHRVVYVAEEIILVRHQREDGQRAQTFKHLWAQRPVGGHVGIHAVVGLGPTADGGVAPPLRRIASRRVRLL